MYFSAEDFSGRNEKLWSLKPRTTEGPRTTTREARTTDRGSTVQRSTLSDIIWSYLKMGGQNAGRT